MLEIGTLLDNKYRILAEVGHGGMSAVYLALNEKANQQWAVKEMTKSLDGQTLITEIEILKGLNNPHLPRIIDVIEEDDKLFMVMDYIEGITLRKKLRDEKAIDQDTVVDWMLQICDVLEYLHTQDPPIIYKDLKPDNIMLKPDGTIVLIDFGAARKFKNDGQLDTTKLGTEGYAAPEQFDNPRTDPRTDIYTVGTTMFRLLTGRSPLLAPVKPVTEIKSEISSGIAAIITKCTQTEKEDRYQSCAELKNALLNYKSLEKGYLKKAKKKLAMFFITLILAILCTAGFLLANSYKNKLKSENYDYYIRMGKSASSVELSLEYYKEAIQIDASKEDAYLNLLSLYLSDNSFTTDEANSILEVLGYASSSSNITNEMQLMENEEGYAEFAFQLGLAYFYYQENGKASSEPWFYIAKESTTLSTSQIKRAQILYEIAGYYSELSSLNLAGDSTVSYSEYFNDLTEFLDYNLVEEDNVKTALVTYKEIVIQILNNTYNFAKDGITQDELVQALELIERHLSTDFSDASLDDSDTQTLSEIGSNIEVAYTTIDATFQEVE